MISAEFKSAGPRLRWGSLAVRDALRRGVRAGLCVAVATAVSAGQVAGAQAAAGVAHGSAAARSAYLAGVRDLQRDELDAAEREFDRAVELDPKTPEYAIALQVVREHRLTALVQQASQARLSGNSAKADALLEQARAIDPANPLVVEHTQSRTVDGQGAQGAASPTPASALDRTRVQTLAPAAPAGWKLPPPVLAGAIRLEPSAAPASLHLRGGSREVLTQIALAYGLRADFDDSVEQMPMRFDMNSATDPQAMPVAEQMARVFAVPVDASTVLFAKDDPTDRQRLEPLLEETIYLPGVSAQQITEIASVIRTIFGITKTSVQSNAEAIVVRAPQAVLDPMNLTLEQFIDSSSEVMLEVKLYEIDRTKNTNIGATIPTQVGIYNVESEAANLVSSNQGLVQQAIAQGYISPTANNLEIALALIGSGLVQSALLSSTIGFFGNGLTLTGLTETGPLGFNLALNESETRALDDVEMNVGDGQPGTFRSGTRYPITTSTYTTGISTPASALSNASINGVSVASLLSQYTGGSSLTIPQVQYEDLGLTLKATPKIERSGRVSMALDMTIEALSGASLDGDPILNNRQFVSTISVGDGETAMMVSNMNRTETVAVSGMPGLGELPGFQVPLNEDVEKDTAQLVMLITPHVIRRRMNPLAGPELLMRIPNTSTGTEPVLPAQPLAAPEAAPQGAPALPPGSPPEQPGQPAPGGAPVATPDVGLPSAFPTTSNSPAPAAAAPQP